MSPRVRRMVTLIAGWTFLVLGVLGLFLPFLQGILFLAVGLVILSREQHWAHRLMEGLRRRFPRLVGPLDRAHAKVDGLLHRWLHPRT